MRRRGGEGGRSRLEGREKEKGRERTAALLLQPYETSTNWDLRGLLRQSPAPIEKAQTAGLNPQTIL